MLAKSKIKCVGLTQASTTVLRRSNIAT
jgi:hypothetical protein